MLTEGIQLDRLIIDGDIVLKKKHTVRFRYLDCVVHKDATTEKKNKN